MLFFDIESTDLKASFGHVLCFGYQYHGEPAQVISLDDFRRPRRGQEPDVHLVKRIHEILTNEADILVSFYGKEFDRKFLNTRMLLAGLSPLPPLNAEHIDLYYTARGNLALHSNRLQSVSESLGCPMSKTAVRADTWRQAMRGDKAAMAYVIEHCRLDVEILSWCYEKLRAFIRQHPPVSAIRDACRICGSQAWENRGRRFVRGSTQTRLRCRQCGTWAYQALAGVVTK